MTWHTLVDPAFSGRLCLTLWHSVWQVTLLALAAWCFERLWGGLSVERRYTLSVTALLAALVALPITYLVIDVAERPSDAVIESPTLAATVASDLTPPTPIAADAVDPAETSRSAPPAKAGGRNLIDSGGDSFVVERSTSRSSAPWLSLAPWIATFYVVGVALMLARLVAAIIRTNRLGSHADPVTDGPLVVALRSLAHQWSMKVVPTLARSEQIVVPKVVGLARTMILLPASTMSGLSTDELEMILAHELAHVQRNDMWVNLVQRLAEAVHFFNPALWCLSRRISTLREYCCDEMTCGVQSASAPETRVRYATALLRVAELAKPDPTAASRLASLAAGGRSPSEVRRRVARLFGEPLREPLRVSPGGAWTLVSLGAALAIGLPMWKTQAEPPTAPRAGTTVESNNDEMPFEFRLNVVEPNGVPVPNASVEIRATPPPTADQILLGQFVRTGTYGVMLKADGHGQLAVTFPRQPTRLLLSIKQPGYGPYWTGWDSTIHPQDVPQEFTAELDTGWSVGGVVIDAAGQPVEGVQVSPNVYYKKRPGDTERLGVGSRIVTDAEGKWRFDHVPASNRDIHVAFNHPDFGPLRRSLPRDGFEVAENAAPTASIELQRGLVGTGIVTDESGQPIATALVRTKFLNDIREATTNERGEYRLAGCEQRMTRIVVSAKGRATDMQEVRVEPDMAPVNFSMKPGGKIRIRVVDEQGKGIAKARIFFQRWRGMIDYFEFDHVNQYADEDGVWEWNEAPLDEFKADICRPGGMQLSKQSLIAREEEYIFRPPRALVVSGNVVDAKTKAPISKFRVIPGLRNRDPRIRMNWIPGDSYDATGGTYRIRMRHDYPAHLIRIEADGYKVAISRDIMTDEGEVDLDFELHRATDIAATILTAGGELAVDAKIALGVAGSQITIDKGDIDDGSTYATRLVADAAGFFNVPARDEPFQLVITHPSGFAYWKSTDGPIPSRITLTPWARVEGTFRVGAQPAPNVVLSMFAAGIHSYGDGAPNIFTHHDVTTGEDGRFVFERVFPGKGRIGRRIFLMVDEGATEVTSSLRVSAEFIAGKTTRLDLGGSGRPVVGKLAPPADFSDRVLWNFALVHVRPDLQPPRAPAAPADIRDEPELRRGWWEAWKSTDEGKRWTAAYEAYEQHRSEYPYGTASVDQDGSFRIDDVPAGDYVLGVRFSKMSPGSVSGYHFSVPQLENVLETKPLDLGTLILH